ncbi:MAG: amphi-Trp domain-containing protein [Proteobacteria bacterium]|nr:amphi-Trp domain-containing protein [Pseudomonadota bacterium]MBU1736829.1 amphi-Trp domain-containing protein [Pseudomonadota bacterium]
MSDKQDFIFESLQDTQTIKGYLESILEGLEKGKIILRSNGEEICLEPANLVKLGIKARKKGTTRKLTMKLSWKEEKGVTISSIKQLDIVN